MASRRHFADRFPFVGTSRADERLLKEEFEVHQTVYEIFRLHPVKGVQVPTPLGFEENTRDGPFGTINMSLVSCHRHPHRYRLHHERIHYPCCIGTSPMQSSLSNSKRSSTNTCSAPKGSKLAGAVTTTLQRGDFEQADIPIEHLLEAIGQALATIHYAAKVDGNDVEFVLGGTPEGRESVISAGDELSENGGDGAEQEGTDWKMSIWIIDFDRAKTIAHSTEVEEQFVGI
jgi:hypothetical protein